MLKLVEFRRVLFRSARYRPLGGRRFARAVVGDVDDAGHAQSGREPDAVFTPAREIDAELPAARALVVTRGQALAAHMLSGAETPSSARPLRSTCCTP